MIGINCKAKKFQIDIQDRRLCDSFLMLEGDILVGGKVSCRLSSEAIVTNIGRIGLVTVRLMPFGNDKCIGHLLCVRLKSMSQKTTIASIRHYLIQRQDLFRRHVLISHNKSNIVKWHHPQHQTMFETKQAILHYQNMNELWKHFLGEHEKMELCMQNGRLPNTAPMLFCNNALWEIRKAKDLVCFCKECEFFRLLQQGITGACASIEKIIGPSEKCCTSFCQDFFFH
jgi:hypothetical protein